MSTVTHKGRFTNQADDLYEVHISVETDEEIEPVELLFSAEDTTIEWKDTALHEALHGSALTLHVISPGDRTFTHLYTIDPTRVRVTLYRNGLLFWRGCIDPEQYEEPYQYRDDYAVMLTFTDIDPLDRIKFNQLIGRRHSLDYLISECIAKVGYHDGYTHAYTIHDHEGKLLSTTDIYYQDSNFYDEDGEPSTLREVLEAVLQPLGLHLIQRAGTFVVYDIDTLYASVPEAVYWESDDQSLSVGKTYSIIRINQSPYGDTTAAEGDLSADDVVFDGGSTTQSYKLDAYSSAGNVGFDIEFGPRITKPGGLTIGSDLVDSSGVLNYYRINAIYSGSDDAGIASVIKTGRSGGITSVFGGNCPNPHYIGAIGTQQYYPNLGHHFALDPIPLGSANGKYFIKITLDMLLDTRYNPFEQADEYNDEETYKVQCERWNFVYVPCRIYVTDDNGRITHYYTNYDATHTMGVRPASLQGHWTSASNGTAPWGECWLAYYDWEDRKKKSGCNGWATNRRAIPRYVDSLPSWWSKRGDGEFIDLPPVSGHCMLHVEFGRGATPLDYRGVIWNGKKQELGSATDVKEIPKIRWQLFRNPKVELVDRYGKGVDVHDLIYSCEVTPGAHDELEIDTLCGSDTYTLPNARGLYHLADGTALGRRQIGDDAGSYVVSLEGALISILASQYEQRSTVLNGAAEPSERACPVYTVNTEPVDARFMATAEVLDLISGSSDITLTQIFPTRFHTVTEE